MNPAKPKSALAAIDEMKYGLFKSTIMKKYICILAGAALLSACEQKTETAAPAASPSASAPETTTSADTPTPSPAAP